MMERLTKVDGCGIGDIIACFASYPGCESEKCGFCEKPKEAYAKLTAYEDTGLTPERVAELAEAERDGRMVVLPCKVGTPLYRVAGISGTTANVKIIREDFRLLHYNMKTRRLHNDIFLTISELEAALAAQKGSDSVPLTNGMKG